MSTIEQTYRDMIDEMKMVYLHDNRPWTVGFSGGKDSTLLVTLVFQMVNELKPEQRTKKIYVISSDTMVENPIVKKYMHDMSKQINEAGKELGIEGVIITPPCDRTFWAYTIGYGYPTPEPPGFRWCTDRLKIKPINNYTLQRIKEDGEIIMLLGVRKAESSYRARGIKAREIEGKLLVPHTDIENAYVYNPLTEIPNEDIWKFLLSGEAKSPWGGDNKYLFSLYQGETLDEEGSVLGHIDDKKVAITGNSRFGCWICTMVKEDKSLKNFIDKGCKELEPLRDFRNWLLDIRNNPDYREKKRRNGSVYVKSDGEFGYGPFNIFGREMILRKLLQLQKETGMELITLGELKAIDHIWEKEGDLTRRRLVDIYFEEMGERLPWDDLKVALYSSETMEIINQMCNEYEVDFELISKLIVAIEENKHYTRGNKVQKAFDRVVNEGWLHYNNIQKAKDVIEHED